jgi:hypothetical protein
VTLTDDRPRREPTGFVSTLLAIGTQWRQSAVLAALVLGACGTSLHAIQQSAPKEFGSWPMPPLSLRECVAEATGNRYWAIRGAREPAPMPRKPGDPVNLFIYTPLPMSVFRGSKPLGMLTFITNSSSLTHVEARYLSEPGVQAVTEIRELTLRRCGPSAS